ncbi:hypothetical protein [Nonomuraea sp. SBT364]|uniref:hypothetical protein n=1 Tax=Nonomuraea sp. SBT364 TaxID=1580530 RepID=UPI0012E2BA49|nr:hypothetical protein [Nonomuraea sp. SBT364]
MTSIEDRLRDALAARAETVRDEGPPPPLPGHPSGHAPRAGRGWRAPVAVAAAIVTVVAGVTLATRTPAEEGPAAHPTLPATPANEGQQPSGLPDNRLRPTLPPIPAGEISPAVEEVWPDAVHRVPDRAPGGQAFDVSVFVDEDTLVGRGMVKARPRTIWSYDLDSRTFTEIAPMTMPGVMNAALAYGEGTLAWSTFHEGAVEIWAVPLTGGTPRRVTTFEAVLIDDTFRGIRLDIAAGQVVWSQEKGGVHRAPLTGGKPETVPGSEMYELLEWPWARSTSEAPGRLLDLRTGEPGELGPEGMTCGVVWCVDAREAVRRDGTGRRELPGLPSLSVPFTMSVVLLDQRLDDGRATVALQELESGRTGLLGFAPTRAGDRAMPTLHVQDDLLWFRQGTETLIINYKGMNR